jgi:hypothetical protein
MQPATGVRRLKLNPHQLTDAVTATENLFVLAHLGVARIDPGHWSLTVDGLVGRAHALTLDDLKARPRKTVEAVHQCCGNPLEPKVPTRRYANVRWGGVDLTAVLDESGIDALPARMHHHAGAIGDSSMLRLPFFDVGDGERCIRICRRAPADVDHDDRNDQFVDT